VYMLCTDGIGRPLIEPTTCTLAGWS
jgi:hypothetical protein